MRISLAPILLAVELGFLFAVARRAAPSGRVGPLYAYVGWLSAYGIAVSALGARGVWISETVLGTLPGLWVPTLGVVAGVVPVVLFAGVRAALRRAIDATPWAWFAGFHCLRLAAVGTAYRTWRGEFPESFEVGVGIPDLLFGISAVWVTRRAIRGELGERAFLLWNLLGVLAVVPGAPVFLQLGLPGPFHVFTSEPDGRAVLTYPMSIAPAIGVPIFVLANLGVAWRLWERGGLIRRTP